MTQGTPSFLGTGWSFPPTFSRLARGVMMSEGERDIHESLAILFSTVPGERVMLPGYGCDLNRMVFSGIDATAKARIADMLTRAILNWEPRIIVDRIDVESQASVRGMVGIHVAYTIRQNNVRSNYVYPFYIEEATIGSPAP